MKRLNICVDIDGTMTDPYYFMPYFNKFFGKNLTSKDCTLIQLHELYELNREQMDHFYALEGENMHRNAIILPKVSEIMGELKQSHNLFIVTARLKEMEHITLEWLERHNIKDIALYSLGSHYKVDQANALQCDIFIEDNPKISLELANAGIKVLLMDTNYNKEISHKNIIRVQNWKDIREHIVKISEKEEGYYGRSQHHQ